LHRGTANGRVRSKPDQGRDVLTIRSEQLHALVAAQIDRANQELAVYARDRFPQLCDGVWDEALPRLAGRIRNQGKQFGLTREDQFAIFLDLAIMYGEDFPKQDWAAQILQRPNVPPTASLELLVRRVRASGVPI
jgi:hypothetical protein